MKQRPGEKIKMLSVDELLGVPTGDPVTDILVEKIYPFEGHPFKVVDDEKMEELVESIEHNGVLTPVIVRPDDEGGYEMISGHRRLFAAKKVGLLVIPATIKEMTDDDAVIAMVIGRPEPVAHPLNCNAECPYGKGKSFCFPCMAKIMAEHNAAKKGNVKGADNKEA